MTWGNHQAAIISGYKDVVERSLSRKEQILRRVGTKIRMGDTEVFIKHKQNGDYVINDIKIQANSSTSDATYTPKRIATVGRDWITIANPSKNTWTMRSVFNLSILQHRTLGEQHVIVRQDAIKGYPETKIRMDRPIKINVHTHEMVQDHKLKKRHFDKDLSKRLKEVHESFRHEFSVLAKFPRAILPYMEIENRDGSYGLHRLPITIAGKTYTTERENRYRYQPRTTDGLMNTRWLGKVTYKMNDAERMKLAILTLFETTLGYTQELETSLNYMQGNANGLAGAPKLWEALARKYFYGDQSIERARTHLGIVKYKEQ